MVDNNKQYESFGSVLKRIRKKRGLTQKELAEGCGVNHSTVSRIEQPGSKVPDKKMVAAIINTLGPNIYDKSALLKSAGTTVIVDIALGGKSAIIFVDGRQIHMEEVEEVSITSLGDVRIK